MALANVSTLGQAMVDTKGQANVSTRSIQGNYQGFCESTLSKKHFLRRITITSIISHLFWFYEMPIRNFEIDLRS